MIESILTVLLAAIILFILVRWHSRITAYICPRCHNKFTITPFIDFISPQGFTSKYLKCPNCGKRVWAKVIRIK